MDMNEYQQRAKETAIYPSEQGMVYTTLGLNGEAGEVAEKIKKMIRDEIPINECIGDIAKELGDVLWYLANLSAEVGLTLNTVAKANLIKLKNRQERNAIKGSGDER